jgi:rhamnopyranosyl-N-acetylglucosaminyl-diphospho-decaprenol beta-1,3/1,4-galactofuranosyltransferase
MRVLAHIHTFNDADIIDQTIESVLKQTRPVDGILVVDNASTDATLTRPSLEHVTVLRERENGGTSGAVGTGMHYALQQNYDWIWILDADSFVDPDALQKLLDLYAEMPKAVQDESAFVACLPRNLKDNQPYHGALFTRDGLSICKPRADESSYLCHISIWSGSLYRLAVVRQIGVPNPDYVLDWGEFEYGNRVMKAGYKGFIDQTSILKHNVRGAPSLDPVDFKLGFAKTTVYEFPPIRCYYMARNMVYFTLYDVAQGRLGLARRVIWTTFKLTANFVLRPRNHMSEIVACFRGIWDGITGNIVARY